MNALRSRLTQWIQPIHFRLRNEKLDLFFRVVDQETTGRLLDIGGGPGITGEFLRLYAAFSGVTILNLEPVQLAMSSHTSIHVVVADGRALPFESGSFDWVFSNAVIEHVGDWKRQRLFANEIRRVAGKGYFVATPNKCFPIEPHTLLPFYQFLPTRLQRYAVRFSPGYLTQPEQINLLSARELQSLFPEAQVRKVGFPILGNSLVAYHSAR